MVSRWKVKGSPKWLQFILNGTSKSVPNLISQVNPSNSWNISLKTIAISLQFRDSLTFHIKNHWRVVKASYNVPTSFYKLMFTIVFKLFDMGREPPLLSPELLTLWNSVLTFFPAVWSSPTWSMLSQVYSTDGFSEPCDNKGSREMDSSIILMNHFHSLTLLLKLPASPTFCSIQTNSATNNSIQQLAVSMLVGWPVGEPRPSSSIPIPHPQTWSKTGVQQQLIFQERLFLKPFCRTGQLIRANIPSCQRTASEGLDPSAT